MIDLYTGEFLISPIPLELSLHYCSHSCAYCFANLNKRDRRADLPTLLRQIRDYPDRRTLVAHWLRGGAPVCFSNRVDPFAASNIRDTLVVLEQLVAQGVPVQWQTRGCIPAHEALLQQALDMLPGPCVWYISVEVWDEARRAQLSPGAPAIAARLALIEELIRRGHRVVIGLNPCVPEWLPGDDAEKLLQAVKARGAEGVWTERLHFSYYQRNQMTEREHSAIGAPLIKRSMKHKTALADRTLLDRVRHTATDVGLEIFSVGQPNASRFFQSMHDLYRTIPTIQDFINHCHDTRQPHALIPFGEWARFFTTGLPNNQWPIDAYIGSTARNMWHTGKLQAQMTFHDLLQVIYTDPRCKMCPVRLPSFAYAALWDGDGWIQLVDPDGMPYLVWSPTGHTDMYCHVPDAADAAVRSDRLDTVAASS